MPQSPQSLLISDPAFPEMLRNIHKPPDLLYMEGALWPSDRYAIAIVGSRHATLYGLRMAEQFAFALSKKGLTIVSGMARGIDASAHRGALKAGGRTIAVLGSSLDRVYPKEHDGLMKEIARNGCVLSEYPPGTEPRPYHFPFRNRIISGLSLGVLVIEASRRSGSLITATTALEQGREVYALPGPVDSLLSEGSHALIKQGAMLVDRPDDILEDLAEVLKDLSQHARAEETAADYAPASNNDEEKLLNLLGEGYRIEVLQERLGMPLAEVRELLLRLEVSGKIRQQYGSYYERV